jgi:hypothetical protein
MSLALFPSSPPFASLTLTCLFFIENFLCYAQITVIRFLECVARVRWLTIYNNKIISKASNYSERDLIAVNKCAHLLPRNCNYLSQNALVVLCITKYRLALTNKRTDVSESFHSDVYDEVEISNFTSNSHTFAHVEMKKKIMKKCMRT